jgi:hypothetical protein
VATRQILIGFRLSKKTDAHIGSKLLILTSRKVEESFLLHACRKSNRILEDNCSGVVVEFAVERPRIRDGKAILDQCRKRESLWYWSRRLKLASPSYGLG